MRPVSAYSFTSLTTPTLSPEVHTSFPYLKYPAARNASDMNVSRG